VWFGKEEVMLRARKERTGCIEPIIHTRGLILQKRKKNCSFKLSSNSYRLKRKGDISIKVKALELENK
jgi:hypothetical protein